MSFKGRLTRFLARRKPVKYELAAACRDGNLETVATLLRAGANPNSTSEAWKPLPLGNGVLWEPPRQHALGQAIRGGSSEVVRLLLDYGANPNANFEINQSGLHISPLLEAVFNGEWESAELLVAAGADVNYKTNNYSVLTSSTSNPKFLVRLMRAGADIRLLEDPRSYMPEVYERPIWPILIQVWNLQPTPEVAADAVEHALQTW